jgi:hypothetical protein
MYWYNPTTRTSERVEAPSTDEQAIRMLAGTKDSAEITKHYCELRRSGRPIEQALVLVGHEFRLGQTDYRLALRRRSASTKWRVLASFRELPFPDVG